MVMRCKTQYFRFILERHPAFLRSCASPLKHPCYAWAAEVAPIQCLASGLLGLFRVVFSIRDDKDNESNNHYSCKNYVQSFRHLLFLLFLRNCIKAEQKYNDSDNKKSNACSIRDLFGKDAAYHSDSKQILGNIHEHFTCFFSSVLVLHDFNYITKREAIGDA